MNATTEPMSEIDRAKHAEWAKARKVFEGHKRRLVERISVLEDKVATLENALTAVLAKLVSQGTAAARTTAAEGTKHV